MTSPSQASPKRRPFPYSSQTVEMFPGLAPCQPTPPLSETLDLFRDLEPCQPDEQGECGRAVGHPSKAKAKPARQGEAGTSAEGASVRAEPSTPSAPVVAPWLRVVREPSAQPPRGESITKPWQAVKMLRDRSNAEIVEVFYMIALDSMNQPMACQEVTRGILNSTLVHPREVFRMAILLGAAGIIIAHNHPSGSTTPSADDRAVTRQLVEAGRILDIPVCDALIITADSYFSFSEAGLL